MPSSFANVVGPGCVLLLAGGKKGVRVLAVHLMSDADVGVYFSSGATPVSASMPLPERGGFVIPASGTGQGWFKAQPGEALNLNIDGAANVGVNLIWAYD